MLSKWNPKQLGLKYSLLLIFKVAFGQLSKVRCSQPQLEVHLKAKSNSIELANPNLTIPCSLELEFHLNSRKSLNLCFTRPKTSWFASSHHFSVFQKEIA